MTPGIISRSPYFVPIVHVAPIGNVGIDGKKPGELDSFLMDKYKIHTVGIVWENINGVRITPNVYTTTKNLDVLVEGITAFAKS